MKQKTNGNQYVQTNTLLTVNQFTQTIRPSQNSMWMGTKHMQIQTLYPPKNSMGTETSMYRDKNVQTNEIRSVDNSTDMISSIMGTQTSI